MRRRRQPSFRLYGVTLESSFPFRYNLEPSAERPDLRFTYRGVAPERDPPGMLVSGSSLEEDRSGVPMRLFAGDGWETIVFPGQAAFHCSQTEICAEAYVPGIEYMIEIWLVGTVMSYWLERQGVCVIHASAVVLDGHAVAFVAGTSRGKSTTACAFVAAGDPLLTDDNLAVEVSAKGVLARPSLPQMKLRADQVALIGGDAQRYEKIHPFYDKLRVPVGDELGRYHNSSVPLACIYLLDRIEEDAGPEVLPMSEGSAFIELVRQSFTAELVDAVDRGPQRLSRLAAIACGAPMRRLRIPAGYTRLGDVRTQVISDLRSRGGHPTSIS